MHLKILIISLILFPLLIGCNKNVAKSIPELHSLQDELFNKDEVKKIANQFSHFYGQINGVVKDDKIKLSLNSFLYERYIIYFEFSVPVINAKPIKDSISLERVVIEEIESLEILIDGRYSLIHGSSFSLDKNEWNSIVTIDELTRVLNLKKHNPVVNFKTFEVSTLKQFNDSAVNR